VSAQLPRRALALSAAVGLSLLPTTALAASAATTGPTTTVLASDVPDLSHSTAGAALPGSTPMRVAVAMSVDQAARDSAYRAITTPGGARYQQFLTPAEFNAEFGVS